MTNSDFQITFSALGFLAVILQGKCKSKRTDKQSAALANDMAVLIEAYCRDTHPELFPNDNKADAAELDQLIEEMKENELHIGQLVNLTDTDLLRRIYERLLQRHQSYATNEMIAGEVAHFLEEEVRHKEGVNMMIGRLQGNEDIFAPCQNMATAIVAILKEKGECSADDLRAKGFSLEDIERHWRMAYALAKVELNWMDS